MLRDFFLGYITSAELAEDVKGSTKQVGSIEWVVEIEDMQEEFSVTRSMLVSLCDAVLSGHLPPDELPAIGFALMASDSFIWEDDVMSEVIEDWSSPEINYALTPENLLSFKKWLLGEEICPTRPQPEDPPTEGRLFSVKRKVAIRPQRERK